MTENKNPEQSSGELLDLISRYTKVGKENKENPATASKTSAEGDYSTKNAGAKPSSPADSEVKVFTGVSGQGGKKAKPAADTVGSEPTRVSNIPVGKSAESEGISSPPLPHITVTEATEEHYTDHSEESGSTSRSAPEGGHFTDDGGNSVEDPMGAEEMYGDLHFTGSESADVKAAARARAKKAYKRAKRRNREKRPHGSLTVSLIKAFAYTAVVFLLSFFAAFGFSDLWPGIIPMANDMFAFVKSDTEIGVTLEEGMTTAEVATLLENNGVIDEQKVFKFYVKFRYMDSEALDGEDDLIGSVLDIAGDFVKTMFFGEEIPEDKDVEYLPGNYTLSPSMNYDQIISTLTTVPYVREEVTVTVPEGYTVDQIIDLLCQNGIGRRENYVYAINHYPYKHEFVKLLEEQGYDERRIYRLEGYLYPDTYIFYKDYDEVDVINKMLNSFSARVWSEYYTTYKPVCEELGFTFDEMVTFASIVQAEGKDFADFECISQVFHNRFDSADFDKMESCATIQYVMEIERLRKQREEGIYEDRVDVLGAEHLAIDTPYNTYMYAGLPVGAICNPGLDAFDAALYPDMAAEVKEEFKLTKAYYFNSDLAGNVYYAQTPYQHSLNQQKAEKVNQQIANGTYVGDEE